MEIKGDIGSLKASVIEEIKSLYDVQFKSYEFIPCEAVQKLCDITSKINREIAIFINRKGIVREVCIGDSHTVSLPELEGRRDKRRLTGLRCIHTHPNGTGDLSSLDINSLLTMKFDAMIAIGVIDKKVNSIFAAILLSKNGEYSDFEIYGPLTCNDTENEYFMQYIFERDKELIINTHEIISRKEKAILVGLDNDSQYLLSSDDLLDELEELANTAGAEVVAKISQKKSHQDSASYIGKGKLNELALTKQSLDADLVIFDNELSGSQIRNIENTVNVKVIDRTSLILDIFAKRARSREGKLQVELAQLKYRLPRLTGLGHVLSKLGGGIGTRGPGEKKLETDKRHIRRKIQHLEREIREISKNRDTLRKNRDSKNMPTVAIVGYTNAGKSTLLNTLCKSDVLVEDKLFATLDPTSRGMKLTDSRDALIIDTVGFIRNLPHQLVESFKSTLEEVVLADLLLHVVDITSPDYQTQINVVNELLSSIGAGNKEVLLVYNKVDKIIKESIPLNLGNHVEISALEGLGIENLIETITNMLKNEVRTVEVFAPYNEGWIYPYMCDNGIVLEKNYTEYGILIKASINAQNFKKIENYIL